MLNIKTYVAPSGREIQVCITPPHQFAVRQQQRLLPSWDVPISYLIVVLQQSSNSLKESTSKVAQEKDYLRANFLRFGCDLISALQDRQYFCDLFDPRTGYPLFARSRMTWDDNAVVKALFNYPVTSYQQCSLLLHPVWKHNVYPSTIITSAPLDIVESCTKQIIADCSWSLKLRTNSLKRFTLNEANLPLKLDTVRPSLMASVV